MLHLIAKPMKKRGRKLLAQIKERLNGTPYLLHTTKSKGDGRAIARKLTEAGEHDIIVIGGDGTLNDVLSGISDPSKCTLGLIPAGTGNDFAASAGIPRGIKALELILNGQPQPTDYIQFADGRRSLNIAGLGIDVDILVRCENMKHLHAKSKYFLSLLVSLCKFRGCALTVTEGETTREYHALIAAICNGKQLGGGIPMCPPASIEDGKLDFVIVENPPKRSQLPSALIKLMRGKVLSLPFAHHTLCESVTITPSQPCVAQYDGELYPTASLEAVLVHGQLKFFRGNHVESV